jgi:dihydropteroate synthase
MTACKLMAVINATPDSYYAQSRVQSVESAIQRARFLEDAGADILDIGAESTRPKGGKQVPEEEELGRLLPIIEAVREASSLPLSVDTMKPAVARAALERGASLLNDVSGFRDPEMVALAAAHDCKVCVMHMPHAPFSDKAPTGYPNGVIQAITDFLSRQVDTLLAAGVSASRIILDPGIGGGQFGKSTEENLLIIKDLGRLKALGFPVLLGISRKTFIREILHCTPEEALAGTLALSSQAVVAGADYIRTHDIPEHRDLLMCLDRLLRAGTADYDKTLDK